MSTDKTYNGWTNYETWNIALWMDNDEGSYNYNRERAETVLGKAEENCHFTKEENAILTLSHILKAEYNELAQDFLEAGKVQRSWIADLMNGALSEVNWHEIANHLIDAAKENVEA